MGLKVQINGQKVGITAPARPPVTFIDGEKVRLTKGVTFIGGEKVTLWGNRGLLMEKIEYPEFTSYGTPQVFYVSQNVAYIGGRGAGASADYVQKLNISNPSAAQQELYVQWGGTITYSADESTDTQSVYYGGVRSGTTTKGNKIVVENGVASVLSSASYSLTKGAGAVVNISGWLMTETETSRTQVGTTTSTNVYFNGAKKYSVNGASYVMTRYNNTQALVPSGVNVRSWTANQNTVLFGRPANVSNLLVDGTSVLVCDAQGVSLVNGSGVDVWRYDFAARDTTAFVVGKIRDYYVVYENGQIVALNTTDGQVYIAEPAPTTFQRVYTTPHISQTGFLGIGNQYYGFYRISIV